MRTGKTYLWWRVQQGESERYYHNIGAGPEHPELVCDWVRQIKIITHQGPQPLPTVPHTKLLHILSLVPNLLVPKSLVPKSYCKIRRVNI
jgi:hypothetical protein